MQTPRTGFRMYFLSFIAIAAGSCAAPKRTSQVKAIYDRAGHRLPDADVNSSAVDWSTPSAADAANARYAAIGSYLPVGCTTTFIETHGKGDAPAYVLTNGHCYNDGSLPGADAVVTNFDTDVTADLGRFFDAQDQERKLHAGRVVYATLRGTDLAIAQLDSTYTQLVASGLKPIEISTTPAHEGDPIEVVGVPLEGVRFANQVLHRATCNVGKHVNLLENGYHTEGSIRIRCSIVGGNSGSPVLSQATHQMVAIANTGSREADADQPDCSDSRPCETDGSGAGVTHPEENYAAPVQAIPTCFNDQGVFDLQTPGCELPRPH